MRIDALTKLQTLAGLSVWVSDESGLLQGADGSTPRLGETIEACIETVAALQQWERMRERKR